MKNLDFDSLVYLDDPDERIKYAEGVIADREAEKAIDAHEREFGADGTRVFGEPESEEESFTSDIEAQLNKFVPVVSDAISQDTAYCNACGHSDYDNAVMEGNAAIRRAVLNLKDMELLKLFLDNIEFRHELYPRVIANTYEVRQLCSVGCRLIEHDNKLGVCKHGSCGVALQQIFHILSYSRDESSVLTHTLPKGKEKVCRIFVLEKQVYLINKDIGLTTFCFVRRNTIEDIIENYKHTSS